MRVPDGGSGGGDAGGRYAYLGDDPTSVDLLMSTLTARAADMTGLADSVAGHIPRLRSAWPAGEAADAAVADVERTQTFTASVPPVLSGGSTALETYHAVLVSVRRTVDALNSAYAVLAPVQNRVAGFGDWIDARQAAAYEKAGADFQVAQSQTGYASAADIDGAYEAAKRTVTGARDECGAALARLTRDGQAPNGRAGTSAFASSVTAGTASLDELLAGQGLTSVPTSSEGVKQFWDTLSPSERQRLLEEDPGRWGNTNGLPTLDRDFANRGTLVGEQDRFAQYFRDHGIEPPKTVGEIQRLKTWQLDALGLYHGLTIATDGSVAAMLERYKDVLSTQFVLERSAKRSVPAFLLTFDSARFDGAGRVAVAFGDPDTADNIGISVPGLESRASKMDQVGADALTLFTEAKKADLGVRTATIAWQGYDAPEFLTVASQDNAQGGAPLLAGDVHALAVTHHGDPLITVVAHSYGSTTTGIALQHNGLAGDADQVILIGSPGVGSNAQDVRDLHLSPDQLFVGSASRDLVTTNLAVLGANPADDTFGGARFEAENVNRDGGLNFVDHSRYYDAGTHSESLYNMADIVSGHADRLLSDGMLAAPRHTDVTYAGPYGGSTVVTTDPEYDRRPTGGHQH